MHYFSIAKAARNDFHHANETLWQCWLSSPKSCTSASWAQAEQETKIDCLFQSSSQSHGITSTPTKLWSLLPIYLALKRIVHQFQLYVQKLKKQKPV